MRGFVSALKRPFGNLSMIGVARLRLHASWEKEARALPFVADAGAGDELRLRCAIGACCDGMRGPLALVQLVNTRDVGFLPGSSGDGGISALHGRRSLLRACWLQT
mmetsp:Transcript_772/g.2756  ORF Transcript_772/g.2756 Transcript_772/m.2756 type:complete len:106 (-) Transcript_772:411-728(-)